MRLTKHFFHFIGGLVESKDHRSIFYAVQRLSDKLHDEKEQSIQVGWKDYIKTSDLECTDLPWAYWRHNSVFL